MPHTTLIVNSKYNKLDRCLLYIYWYLRNGFQLCSSTSGAELIYILVSPVPIFTFEEINECLILHPSRLLFFPSTHLHSLLLTSSRCKKLSVDIFCVMLQGDKMASPKGKSKKAMKAKEVVVAQEDSDDSSDDSEVIQVYSVEISPIHVLPGACQVSSL